MLWLSKRPEWQRCREFETTTRTISPGMMSGSNADNSFGDDDLEDAVPSETIQVEVCYSDMPLFDESHE